MTHTDHSPPSCTLHLIAFLTPLCLLFLSQVVLTALFFIYLKSPDRFHHDMVTGGAEGSDVCKANSLTVGWGEVLKEWRVDGWG